MNLVVEAFQRPSGGYVALVQEFSQPVSEGGVGAAAGERAAIQEAINSFFSRREAETTAAEQPVATLDPPANSTFFTRRVGVTRAGILAVLREATENGERVRIDYTDAEGAQTSRTIRPFNITDDLFPLVRAEDDLRGENRTFRTDRISRAEVI